MEQIREQFHKPEIGKDYRKIEHALVVPGIQLLDQSGLRSRPLPPADGLKILDNACGTGVITSLIKVEDKFKDVEVTAVDISELMVDSTKKRVQEENWKNVNTVIGDAMDLKLPSNYFSHTITNFCFQMLTDPAKGMQGESHLDLIVRV
ncbi:S-adenosyl-L-methionine-dependent methyltransferase [Atractiella rhizophila]|nr:S-adenosyl-L-methionine-dependent methyltransferase [Atractiella rhizophila]